MEWGYINAAGVCPEVELSALSLARQGSSDTAELALLLALAEDSFKAALEVLSMRAQYFQNICADGVEQARQLDFLLEQNFDAVHSESYRAYLDSLQGKVELEATKQLTKVQLG